MERVREQHSKVKRIRTARKRDRTKRGRESERIRDGERDGGR